MHSRGLDWTDKDGRATSCHLGSRASDSRMIQRKSRQLSNQMWHDLARVQCCGRPDSGPSYHLPSNGKVYSCHPRATVNGYCCSSLSSFVFRLGARKTPRICENSQIRGAIRPFVRPFRTELLEVFVLRPLSRLRFLRLFPRVFAGTHVTEPEVRIERGKTVVLDAPGIVAYADGERVWELPAHVDVVPAAVRVFI